MADMRTWITAIVALIVGAAIGYFVTQGQVGDLEARLSAAETELVQANETAGAMAAEAEELGAENQALMEENEALRAELEAAAQPTPEPEEVEEADEVDEPDEVDETEEEEEDE
jgi:regulator of replication initiation timing